MNLIINNYKIRVVEHNKNQVLLCILLLIDLRSPFEALKSNLKSALSIGSEIKSSWAKKIKNLNQIGTKEGLIKFYFNLLLSLENLSTLYGFSCNCKIDVGRSHYNPEIIRMSKKWDD